MAIKDQPKTRIDFASRNRKLEWRAQWFGMHRPETDKDLIITRNGALEVKQAKIKKQFELADLPMAAYGAPGTGTPWYSIGPRNINGRVKALAIHPTDPDTVYAGAASGGVWKSEDGGQSWRALWHDEEALAVGGLAIAPSNPNRIYAGTGEGVIPNTYGAAHNYPGVGIYVSNDAGTTWDLKGGCTNRRTTQVLIDATDDLLVYVAGPDGFESSSDGGNTWTMLRAGVVSDAVLDPNDSTVMYICVHNDGVYKSTDSGGTWTQLTNAPTGVALKWPRIDICKTGTYGSDFLVLKNSAGSAVYYTTTDGGATWNLISGFSISHWMGWCDLVAVAPDDENYILAGGVGLSGTTNGGSSWSSVSGLHADHHRAVYAPSNPDIVYECNDGGVYRSDDKGLTFKKVSHGLVITQFYDVGSWNPISNVVGGGTQDQGTNMTSGGLTWKQVFGWDGGYMVFDPTDPRTMYSESQGTNIRKSSDGGNTWVVKTGGLSGTSQWVGTIVMDPNNHDVLYTGGNKVFKTSDALATNWVDVSQDFGFSVNSIAVAPSDSNRVYCGTGNFYNRTGQGKVFRSDDAGATSPWTEITGTLPSARAVMDVVVDSSDADRVFVAYGGTTGGVASHVFMSTDAGVTWTDISGDLPDTPVSALALDHNDPNTIYVGTDVGVFATNNLGASWLAYDNGIPNSPIHDLHVDESENFLYAATFGRGMYKLNIAPVVSTPAVDLYLRDSLLDVGQLIPSPSGQPNPNDTGDTVYWWESPDIKADVAPYFTPDGLFDGVEFDDDLSHEDPQRGVTNRFYLQVHNRGYENATNVSVRAFIADASAGLPALPAALTPPDFTIPAGAWTALGSAQTIPVLEPNRPVIVSWDFTVPVSAATHSCLLAVVSSSEDPITTTETNVNVLIPNEKRVALKNLHVIDAPPSPLQQLVAIKFHNVLDRDDLLDIVIRPEDMENGVIGLVLQPHQLADPNPQHALKDVAIYQLAEKEDVGTWYQRQSRQRCSGYEKKHGPDVDKELEKHRAEMLSRMDLTQLYEFNPMRQAEIRGIKVAKNQTLEGVLTVKGRRAKGNQGLQRFSVLQRQDGQIVGGSTYEIRSRWTRAMHAVSLIRVVLEKVQILDDKDPWFFGRGEFVFNGWVHFNNNPNRSHRIRIPDKGHLKISDKPGKNIVQLDTVIFEGYVGANDNMSITILPEEQDLFTRDDNLVRYHRTFMAPPEHWVGHYVPGDEEPGKDAERLPDWRLWYRIESLSFVVGDRT
ncbi:WD40/YVTN/BNR-like repeat-containing protein [Kaarinaea lacus]